MTDKEFRHLSRAELLRMLLEVTKESERQARELENMKLQLEECQAKAREEKEARERELAETKRLLEEKTIAIQDAGSLAEAAVQISRVLQAAQNAADLYLENSRRIYTDTVQKQYEEFQDKMRAMEQKTRRKCMLMLKETRKKAGGDPEADAGQEKEP